MSPDHTNDGPPTGSGRRRFWRLTAINIASNLTVPLTGLVDTAMLGRLEEVTFLAGVALSALIFDTLYFGLGFLRMSTTGQTAQAQGRGDEALAVLWRSGALALLLGSCILLFQPLIEDLAFLVLGGTPAVEAVGRDYFRARVLGAPAAVLQLAVVGWLLGRGRSGAVLAMMTVTNLLNVLLNGWFILILGWAAQGAGWASAAAQGCGILVGLGLVRRALPRRLYDLRQALRGEPILDLLRLNSQIFVRTMLLVGCFAVFTDGSARLGTVILAANTILLRWLSVLSYFVDGVAYATETVAGNLWGAGHRERLRSFLRYSLLVGSVLGAAVWIPVALFPTTLTSWFTHHREVVVLASSLSWWMAPIGLFGTLAYVLDGFFLGLTRGSTLMKAMLVSGGLALAVMIGAVHQGSVNLLWAGMATLMLARALTLGGASRRVLAGSWP